MAEAADTSRPGVWITRAEPGARATAERVAALGFVPIVAPLLSFYPLDADPTLGVDEALAFTSINGVRRAAALMPSRDMMVFAVGDATAAAAREAGFSKVTSAHGDVEALSTLIRRYRPKGGVAHPCARETAGDLVAALRVAGTPARKIAVYETRAAVDLPQTVDEALAEGRLKLIVLHSPKAARTAADLLARRSDALRGVAAVGLSAACIEPLQACGFRSRSAAEAPTEDALMRLLVSLASRDPGVARNG